VADNNRIKWKIEYDYTVYKVYDGKGNLAGYFFPHYGSIAPQEKEDEIIEKMNKAHEVMHEGTLLVPMAKLDLLDHEEGLDIDAAIQSLESNLERTKFWNNWLAENAKQFSIFGSTVYTAREDRNMLSIALGIAAKYALGEKEIRELLTPVLDKLHADALL
jgi:hypothetical protein